MEQFENSKVFCTTPETDTVCADLPHTDTERGNTRALTSHSATAADIAPITLFHRDSYFADAPLNCELNANGAFELVTMLRFK